MTRVELVSLRLRHFKGAQSFDLDLDGRSAVVTGRNSTGKTTLFDAWSWLTAETDSAGRKQFDIKTIDAVTGEPLHMVDHEVEAALKVDGRKVELRRVYKEKWVKKRGSATDEFTGHEVLHFVDDVPVSKGEYVERLEKIADPAVWRLVSDPFAFQALHWQERRKLLLEVCGDVSDEDVIASDPALADLSEILGDRTLDEHKRVVVAAKARINKELQEIPARIDEVRRGLPTVEGNLKKVEKDLAAASEERSEAAEELAAAKAGGGDLATERRRLSEVDRALSDLDLKGQREHAQKVQEAEQAAARASGELQDAEARVTRHEERITDLEADAAALDPQLAALREEWGEISKRTFEATHVEESCPACGQGLPADRVEAANQKALEEFNARKARELERVKAEGDRLKKRQVALKADADLARGALENQRQGIAQLQGKVKNLGAKAEAARSAPITDAASTPEYAKLRAEADELRGKLDAASQGDPEAVAALQERLQELDGRIGTLQEAKAAHARLATGEKRLEELTAQERTLAEEYEDLEHQVYLLESFTRAKVAMLEDKVASRFDLVRFRLFRQQVNGGIEECCDATVAGVPFDSVNHAGRIAAGLDIVKALQAHFELQAPVWVDQAESIHDIPETGAQQIALVVDRTQKELRVELQATEVAA